MGDGPADEDAITLAEKVAFLAAPDAYQQRPREVVCRETHMSWVFLAGDTAYKLKKPVRFSYLDFSTIDRREKACRAELAINQTMAPHVYLRVAALTKSNEGLSIGGGGEIVDWLVVMRRLPDDHMLDRELLAAPPEPARLNRLAGILADFYRHATPVLVSRAAHLAEWRKRLAENRRVLAMLDSHFDPAKLRLIDTAQRSFLKRRSAALEDRVTRRHIVDGHGDLRPEHISLTEPIAIIDRLEFDPRLRVCDPFDELASLVVECAYIGQGSVGEVVLRAVGRLLHDSVSEDLLAFYRCYRATLRARLSIAHLLDADCKTPAKWPSVAQRYLLLAAGDALALLRSYR
jgi:aminoglycoside phosphotransferase family enzyme